MNDFSLLLVAFGIIGITVLTSFARLIINTVRLFSTTRLLILKLHSTLYPHSSLDYLRRQPLPLMFPFAIENAPKNDFFF